MNKLDYLFIILILNYLNVQYYYCNISFNSDNHNRSASILLSSITRLNRLNDNSDTLNDNNLNNTLNNINLNNNNVNSSLNNTILKIQENSIKFMKSDHNLSSTNLISSNFTVDGDNFKINDSQIKNKLTSFNDNNFISISSKIGSIFNFITRTEILFKNDKTNLTIHNPIITKDDNFVDYLLILSLAIFILISVTVIGFGIAGIPCFTSFFICDRCMGCFIRRGYFHV